jgi:hypothetical protein
MDRLIIEYRLPMETRIFCLPNPASCCPDIVGKPIARDTSDRSGTITDRTDVPEAELSVLLR